MSPAGTRPPCNRNTGRNRPHIPDRNISRRIGTWLEARVREAACMAGETRCGSTGVGMGRAGAVIHAWGACQGRYMHGVRGTQTGESGRESGMGGLRRTRQQGHAVGVVRHGRRMHGRPPVPVWLSVVPRQRRGAPWRGVRGPRLLDGVKRLWRRQAAERMRRRGGWGGFKGRPRRGGGVCGRGLLRGGG